MSRDHKMHTHHAVPVEFRQYTSHHEKGDGRKKQVSQEELSRDQTQQLYI